MKSGASGERRLPLDRHLATAIGSGALAAWGFAPFLARWPVLLGGLTAVAASVGALTGRRSQPEPAPEPAADIDLTDGGLARTDLQALVRGEGLVAAFQPIVDLATGAVVGVEALARVQGPDGMVSAEPWLVAAPRFDLGVDLEVAAVTVALRSLRDLPRGVYLSINASPATLISPEFRRALDGTDPARLVVEVTEHDVIEDYVRISGALGGLRAQGLRLAVDDAGAGFSSLRHILRLRPDVIKLDLTLTQEIATDPLQRALAAALADFGKNIGASVVAEGIETTEHADVLREVGVTHGQGYCLGRPAPMARALVRAS